MIFGKPGGVHRTLVSAAVLLVIAAPNARAGPEDGGRDCRDDLGRMAVTGPEQAGDARLLFLPFAVGAPVGEAAGAPRFEALELGRTEIRARVAGAEGEAALVLRDGRCAGAGAERTASFHVTREGARSPALDGALGRLAERVRANDDGTFWRHSVGPDEESGDDDAPASPWTAALVLLGALSLVLLLGWTLLGGERAISGHLRATHLLPSFLQLLLLAYFGLYWPRLGAAVPWIGLEVVFAYALDAALSFGLRRHWRLSFAPLPVVLSTNLFVQFPPDDLAMPFLAVALAIGSKHLLVRGGWRDGRHVFNPSAFGLAAIGLLSLPFPALGSGDVANAFALGPNMSELILVVAVLAQLRVPVVLVSLGAFAGLAASDLAIVPLTSFVDRGAPPPEWAPVLLVLALLLTDPATIPRTGAGRLLSGLATGFAIGAVSLGLTAAGHSDFYSKVLPVPFANLAAPLFDRAGVRLEAAARLRPLALALTPRWNKAHVAVWLATVALVLAARKPYRFDPETQAENRTRFLTAAPGEHPTCAENPLFCEAFSFGPELASWTRALSDRL